MAEVVIWGISAATAGGTVIAAGSAAYVAIQLGVAVATTALSVALSNQAANDNASGGVRTQSITAGEQMPQSFILGRYMTAGNLVAPEMSHGVSGDTRYLTRVVDLGDIAVEGLESLIIDGDECTLGTSGTLTMSDGDGTTPAINSTYGATVQTPQRYTGFAWCQFHNGSQTSADADLLSLYGSYPERPWLSDMIGRGVPYAVLTFLWRDSPQIWNGRPDVKFVVKGIKLYDPRKDSTAGGSGAHRYSNQATWEWSENPVVMVYNILRGIPMLGGNTYGGGYGASDLPYTTWAAAMNACDVPISGRKTYIAGYEVRIGTPDIGGDAPLDVIDELLKACSAEIADVGGTIYIRVGGPAMPVKYITDDDILRSQPQDLDPFPPLENTYNGVHATYPDPDQLWTAREAPPRYDTTAQAEDGGQILIGDLTLPAAPNKTQVQQLMQGWLKDARRMRVHNIPLPPEGDLINPLEVIDWTSTRNGYTGKDFEIAQKVLDPRTLCTTFSIREKDSGDYGWVVGDEIATTAPSAVKVQPAALSVAGWSVAAFSIRDSADAPRKPGIAISWTTPVPGVTDVKWEVRVQATGRNVASGTTPLIKGSDEISEGLVPATQYQVRAKYVTNKSANWTSWTSVTTTGDYIGNEDIAPGSIRASRLARSEANNLVPDNDLTDEDAWSTASGEFTLYAPTSAVGVGSIGEVRRTVTTGTGTKISFGLPFTVKPGRSYYATYQINRIGGTQFDACADIAFYDKDGTYISATQIDDRGIVTGSSVITRAAFATAPSDAVSAKWRWLVVADNTDSAVRFYAPDLRSLITTELIGQRQIKNDQIALGEIRASRLARSEANNLVPDNDIMDADAWSTGSGEFDVLTPTTAVGVGSVGEVRRTVTTGTGVKISTGLLFTVKPLRAYFCLYQVNRIGGTQFEGYAVIQWYDKDEAPIDTDIIDNPGVVTGSSVITRYDTVISPVGAVMAKWSWRVNASVTDSAVRFYAPDMRAIVTGELLASGAVTTLYQDVYAGPTALTTTPTEYAAQTLPAMGQGKIFKRSLTFDARAPSGRTLTITLESRLKDFVGDPWSAWTVERTWTITGTAWNTFRDTGTLAGPFEAYGYRLRASVDSASATTALREACLTVDETTK